MITSAGILLFSLAIVIKLFASDTPATLTKYVILVSGFSGLGMLLASSIILSYRYLP